MLIVDKIYHKERKALRQCVVNSEEQMEKGEPFIYSLSLIYYLLFQG